jgi:hypothetical protein
MIPQQNGLPTAPALRNGPSGPTDLVSTHQFPVIITPSRSPKIPSQINTPPDRLLDIKLFHHYIEMTSGGYINAFRNKGDKSTNDIRATWFNWIVGVAKSSPHLMDALFALAAFHLQHVNAGDKTVIEAGHRYMTRAIQGHSRQLQEGINADNAEEVFAMSTCVTFYVTSGRHLEPNGEQDLLHWFQSWQGMRAVLQSCWNLLKREDLKSLIHNESTMELLNPGKHSDQAEALDTFNFLVDDLSSFDVDPETRTAYETSVQYLNKIYASPAVNRHILKFPGIVTNRYVDLVATKDSRALAILGYYFMLVILAEQIWWLQGAAERDFGFLMKELPEIWKPRMAWAMTEFEFSKMFNEMSL